MLSLVASGKAQGTGLMYADESRAHFYAKAVRPVYVKLADEDFDKGDEHRCGKLMMSMYGTRDAAFNWALEYGDTLRAAGYVQVKSNPCLFYKKENGECSRGRFWQWRISQFDPSSTVQCLSRCLLATQLTSR